MVCVFWFKSVLLLFTDSKQRSAIAIASLPDNLIMATAPAPEAVANATIVSL